MLTAEHERSIQATEHERLAPVDDKTQRYNALNGTGTLAGLFSLASFTKGKQNDGWTCQCYRKQTQLNQHILKKTSDLFQDTKEEEGDVLWQTVLLNSTSPQSNPDTLSDDPDVTLLHKDITQTGWTDQTAEIQSKYDDIWLSAAEVMSQVNAGRMYHVYEITNEKCQLYNPSLLTAAWYLSSFIITAED